jgi:hypothetical protein
VEKKAFETTLTCENQGYHDSQMIGFYGWKFELLNYKPKYINYFDILFLHEKI